MAKIPFDIKYRPQIESGEYKVETRNGSPARVICWDRKHEEYPLVALISGGKFEDCEIYTINGKFYCDQEEHRLDLIIVTTEPELSKFEKAVLEVYEGLWEGPVSKEDAKQKAAELLELAREGYVPRVEKEHAVINEFLHGVEVGRKEALKDLPNE